MSVSALLDPFSKVNWMCIAQHADLEELRSLAMKKKFTLVSWSKRGAKSKMDILS